MCKEKLLSKCLLLIYTLFLFFDVVRPGVVQYSTYSKVSKSGAVTQEEEVETTTSNDTEIEIGEQSMWYPSVSDPMKENEDEENSTEVKTEGRAMSLNKKYFPKYSLSDLSAYTTIDHAQFDKSPSTGEAQDRYNPGQYAFANHGDSHEHDDHDSGDSGDSFGGYPPAGPPAAPPPQPPPPPPMKDHQSFPPNDYSAYAMPAPPPPAPPSDSYNIPDAPGPPAMPPPPDHHHHGEIKYSQLGENEFYTPPPGYQHDHAPAPPPMSAGPPMGYSPPSAPGPSAHDHHPAPAPPPPPPMPSAPSDHGQSAPSGPSDHGHSSAQWFPPPDHDHGYEFDHDVEHYHYAPPPTPAPEIPDQRVNNKYSYYYIGRKLWYIPLFFSIYFIIYIGVLILKSIARHKIQYPDHYKAREIIDPHLNEHDHDHEHAAYVTHAIDQAARKYER